MSTGESFRSSTPGPDLTLRTFTEDVFEVLGILSRMDSIWVQPIVCGQSWGGSVVLELAKLHPESIRGIVCVDGGFIDLQVSIMCITFTSVIVYILTSAFSVSQT